MADQDPVDYPLGEPSVLDYVRARLFFWRGETIALPPLSDGKAAAAVRSRPKRATAVEAPAERPSLNVNWAAIPWQPMVLLFLMLFAQWSIEPPRQAGTRAFLLYAVAAGWALFMQFRGQLALPERKASSEATDFPRVQLIPLIAGLAALLLSVILMRSLRFNPLNLVLWVGGIALVMWSFLEIPFAPRTWLESWQANRRDEEGAGRWAIPVTRWGLLILLVAGVALYFQGGRSALVTADMGSAQVENLLDVQDIADSAWGVFFPRNNGREPLHMYLTALIGGVTGSGISFASLKLAALVEMAVFLFYLYKLGDELGTKRVGLYAMLLAGIAFWPATLGRIGLRYLLLPMAMAAMLYHLLRGLRSASTRQYIAAGVALGIGLLSVRATFVLPLGAVLALVVYLLHHRSIAGLRSALTALVVLLILGFAFSLPLLQFWLRNPAEFRLLSPFVFDVPAGEAAPNFAAILLGNLRNALLMFNWNNGTYSAFTVALRPALDVITAGLLVIGVVLLLGRYLQQRGWQDLAVVLAVPLALVPSMLRVQFPTENPAPHLAAGAMAFVFLFAALALDSLLRGLADTVGENAGRVLALIVGVALVGLAAFQNHVLIFDVFAGQYAERNWNASEIGEVIANFADTIGGPDQAFVVRYPHWVDTRVVGIEAGFPGKDYQVGPEELDLTLDVPTPKLFILHLEDTEGLAALQALYPQGVYSVQQSTQANRDFAVYFVSAGQ